MNFEKFKKIIKKQISGTIFEGKTFFVGGCVRDFLCNKEPNDFDIVVNIQDGAQQLAFFLHNNLPNLFTEPFQLGHYPIWATVCDGMKIEIAETMKEVFEDSKSRQRNVVFSTLKEDVLRRDFTINSLLLDACSFEIFDFVSGKNSIQEGIIKCNDIVSADKIFSEDPLRMIRAITFSIRFNWKIDEATKDSIKRNSKRIEIISQERIVGEINKVVKLRYGLFNFIRLLDELNLLVFIFPEIYNQKAVFQSGDIRNVHLESETVFGHTMLVLFNAKTGLINQLSALFHDIGKTNETRTVVDGKVQFLGHEHDGSLIAEKILKRMTFDSKTVEDVAFLIKHHMDFFRLEPKNKSIRRFIRDIKEENIHHLFFLIEADSHGTLIKNNNFMVPLCFDFVLKNKILDEIERNKNLPKKIFSGKDIMDIFNLSEGKIVGDVLRFVDDLTDEFGFELTKEFLVSKISKQFNFNEEKCLQKLKI